MSLPSATTSQAATVASTSQAGTASSSDGGAVSVGKTVSIGKTGRVLSSDSLAQTASASSAPSAKRWALSAVWGAASHAQGAAVAAGGAAKSVIRRNRSSSSWYKQRQRLRGSVFEAYKWLCGPFLGNFDDMHADPEDEQKERQYEDDSRKKYEEGGRRQKYLDMPVGSLPNELGYTRNKENGKAKNAVDVIRKLNPVAEAAAKVAQDHPDIFLNDLWEVIQVNVEVEGGQMKKKLKGQVIIDQLSPDGPPGDINRLMGWRVPNFEDVDDDELRKDESKLRRTNSGRALIKEVQEAKNYMKLKRALTDRKAAGWSNKRPQLHTLEVIGCGLLEVPPVLREVSTLRHLKLSHNNIKLLTEEWLWPEDERPVVESQYHAKNDHLTGDAAAEVTEHYGDGIPCYLCEPEEGEDSKKFKLIDKVPDHPMKWWETMWVREEVANDDMIRPEAEFWKTIRPQKPDDDEAITDWLLTYPDGDGGRVLTYPMELAGCLVVCQEELELRGSGSVVSGVEYKMIEAKREFPHLEHLFLDWNSIYSIEVQALSGGVVATLQVLNLSHNQLNVLPSDFMQGARELRYLDLTGNERIRIIPDTVMECSKLELLFLTHNSIEQLPPIKKEDAFGRNCKRLKRLRKLFVAYNRLTELPEDIGDCGKLEKIRLSHNCIREMPRSLLKLRHTLQEFAFVGNPLQQPLLDGADIETNMHFFEDYWMQRDSAEGAEDAARTPALATAGTAGSKDLSPEASASRGSSPAFGTGRTLALDMETSGQSAEVDVIHKPSHVGRFEVNPRGAAHRRE
jgi:Leucine-rich repeat (LRR) protein